MLIMMTGRVTKREEGRGKYIPWTLVLQLLCNCEKDNLLNLPLLQFSHLRMGNSVISPCSLVTERMC